MTPRIYVTTAIIRREREMKGEDNNGRKNMKKMIQRRLFPNCGRRAALRVSC